MGRHWRTRGTCRAIVRAAGLQAIEIRCLEDNGRWTEPATETVHRVVITRSGGYLRRVNGVTTFVDATNVLVTRPGDEVAVAHPAGSRDSGTVVKLSDELVEGMPLPPGELRLDDRLDLRHRALLADSRAGLDPFTAADRLLGLLDELRGLRDAAPEPGRAATVQAHRRLVDRAREALLAGGLSLGLDTLAKAVGCSPHHLSRVFRAVTGEPLSTYRNRLRVRAVLSDVQDGAANLRSLAAEYGFADQAHLTRVVRRLLGRSPTEIRQLVTAVDRA
jgi:AraC-like DNA-binding protein